MVNIHTHRYMQLLLAALLTTLICAGCLPQTSSTGSSLEMPDSAADRAPDDLESKSAQLEVLTALLEAAGAAVLIDGQVDQDAFDDAIGWRIQVNGTVLNVFEFGDTSTRLAASDGFTRDRSEPLAAEGHAQGGDPQPLDRFWGHQALLVSYGGQDTEILGLLAATLGEPLLDRTAITNMGTTFVSTSIPIDEHGVGLNLDSSLGTAVKLAVVPGMSVEQASGFTQLVIPDHLVLSFDQSYANELALYRQAANLDSQAHIAIYPVASYTKMNDLANEQVGLLQHLLTGEVQTEFAELPFLPTVNAARSFQAQSSTLLFANGAGVRYLTQVAQETRPVNNSELLYTFQGLTNDGAHYVAAFFPVTTLTLPDDAMVADQVAFDTNFTEYLEATVESLNQLSSAEFEPDLATLDQLIMSLSVQPEPQLLSDGQTEAANEPVSLASAAPPVGLVYSDAEGLWQIDTSGEPRFLLEIRDYRALALSPDLVYAAYFDSDGRLWLADLLDGSVQQLASDTDLSWSLSWANTSTLLLGVWLSPEEKEGLSSGHVATLDIVSGRLDVIDKDYLSLGRPAMAPDGETIAYDISPYYGDRLGTGRLYDPETGPEPFDARSFGEGAADGPQLLLNPVWSPDGTTLTWQQNTPDGRAGLVAFDLTQSVARRLHNWQPLGFGALPPSALWHPEGTLVALETWASDPEDSGLWVLGADGSTAVHVSNGGSNPHWLETGKLVYADCDVNRMCTNMLFDLATGRANVLEMPAGTIQYVPFAPEPPAAQWSQ